MKRNKQDLVDFFKNLKGDHLPNQDNGEIKRQNTTERLPAIDCCDVVTGDCSN